MEKDTPTPTAPEIRSGSNRQSKQQTKHQKKQLETQKQIPLPDPSCKRDINPPGKLSVDDVGPDHPVHKVPLEKQAKWRAKGIDPVLRAEMDEVTRGKRGFWARLGPFLENLNVASSV